MQHQIVRLILVFVTGVLSCLPQTVNPTILTEPPNVAVDHPKEVLVTSRVSLQGLDASSVVLERLNASNSVIAELGRLYDDGTNGDIAAGDGIFSRKLRMTAVMTGGVVIRVRARYAAAGGGFENLWSENRVIGIMRTSVQNADWSGFNYLDFVEMLLKPPAGSSTVVLYRATSPVGPWTDTGRALRDKLYDNVDAREIDLYYRADALDANGQVIKAFAVLKVPAGNEDRILTGTTDIEGSPPQSVPPAEPGVARDFGRPVAASRSAACAINPNPWDREFVSEEEFACWHCMSLRPIRSLFKALPSYFAAVVPDTDGVLIDVPQLIYDNAVLRGINPQILIAKFQGERQCLRSPTRPPGESMASAMGCGTIPTVRSQIECAARNFRLYFDQAANGGQTGGIWKVGVPRLTQDIEHGPANPREALPVTPANRATVALYQYTPYRGHYWGGPKDKPHMTAGNGVLIWIWRNDLKLVAFEGATSMDGPDMELTHDYKTGHYRMQYNATTDPTGADGFSLIALLPPACGYAADIQVDLSTTDRCKRYLLPDGTPTDAGMNECFALGLLGNRYFEVFGYPPAFDDYTPLPTKAKIMAPWGGDDVGPLARRSQAYIGNYPANHIEEQRAGVDLRTANYLNIILDGRAYEGNNAPQYPSWGTVVVRKLKAIF